MLGRPVIARVPARDAVARAVDAGVLAHRLPDLLARPAADRAAGGRAAVGPAGCGGMSTAATRVADGALRRRVHQRLIGSDAVEQLVGAPALELHRRLGDLLHEADPLLAADRHDRLVARARGRGRRARAAGAAARRPVGHRGDGQRLRGAASSSGRVGSSRCRSPSTTPAILRIVERIIAPLGLRLDRASPMVDARLPDGSRLHAVIPPLAIDGACVTIRRFGARADRARGVRAG